MEEKGRRDRVREHGGDEHATTLAASSKASQEREREREREIKMRRRDRKI
jgi:hypothetical protein